MLSARELVDYLLDHELIYPESVVTGDLTIETATGRNHNFKVLTNDGPCYMVKQSEEDYAGLGTLAHEASVYQFLSNGSIGNATRWFLPQLHEFDAKEKILILELTTNAKNLRYLQIRQRNFSRLLARQIGRGLSVLHSIPLSQENQSFDVLYNLWVLTMGLPNSSILYDVSSANLELLRTIQKYPVLSRHLADMKNEWEAISLIHGDFKWDNCIAFSLSNSKRTTRLKIVDWEFSGIGDPCWDVGSVFGDYLSAWLMSIPLTGDSTPERWVELAAFPLEKMQPAINAFWTTYREKSELTDTQAQRRLVKSIRFCAARLLQTAYEQMHQSISLSGNMYCFLQLALNLLERPEEAGVHLLGLPVFQVSKL